MATLQYLPEIRRLLLEGKNAEAEKLAYASFICQSNGSNRARGRGVPYGSYDERTGYIGREVQYRIKLLF